MIDVEIHGQTPRLCRVSAIQMPAYRPLRLDVTEASPLGNRILPIVPALHFPLAMNNLQAEMIMLVLATFPPINIDHPETRLTSARF